MESNDIFNHIVNELNLGILTAEPTRVSGGYMHTMYRVETTTGVYAVKLLNPAIMQRTGAIENFHRAEHLEEVLQSNHIPVICALVINGRKMHLIDNHYIYVFNWVSGKVLQWDEIEAKHCTIAGTILANIHKIEQSSKPCTVNNKIYMA